MTDPQITQIKQLEETVRQLIRQTADIREEAKRTKDRKLRKILLEAADGCEVSAQNLAAGLRGMRENLQ